MKPLVPMNPVRGTKHSSFGSTQRWTGIFFCAIVALCALVQIWPAAQVSLQFERQAIDAGQWWRLATGNFVHYDWLHFGANVGALAIVGWLGLRRSTWTIGLVALAAIVVGVGVHAWAGGIMTYRGVSGVTFALLAWVIVLAAAQERRCMRTAWLIALLLLAVKSVFETAAGCPLLPTSAPAGVEVVGITHMTGLAAGSLAALAALLGHAKRVGRTMAVCKDC